MSQVRRDFTLPNSPVIAAEFCGTSISAESSWDDARTARVAARNPHTLYGKSTVRGYLLGDLNRARLEVRLRGIDDARKARPAAYELARFEVRAGEPGARRVG